MNGYEKRARLKRDAILEAAEKLFSEKGISGTSVTEIAAAANVSRVTLFKYFGDKDTLAREVLKSWIGHLMAEYDAILNSGLPFQDKLLGLLGTKLAGWDRIGDLCVNPAIWDDAEIRKIIMELSAGQSYRKVIDFIAQGKREGLIDKSLDDEAIIAYFTVARPLIENPDYIKRGKSFQSSLYNLFMGGVIKDWYGIVERDKQKDK
jgi:AcrR family transcriptional regulator